MNYRGKGIRWTEDEDRIVLNGGIPEGHTPSQVYNRRSKLKKNFGEVTRTMCRNLIWRLEYMTRMDLFKGNDKKFFYHISKLINKKLL